MNSKDFTYVAIALTVYLALFWIVTFISQQQEIM